MTKFGVVIKTILIKTIAEAILADYVQQQKLEYQTFFLTEIQH